MPRAPAVQRSASPARDGQRLSPNQLAKRDEIVSAAVEVLLRDGVHGCTVRSIAASAGVSKGSVHYYFGDVDEIVDLAMVQATRGWIAWLRASGAGDRTDGPGPVEIFW
ncbi:MAG: TetR/AcrR family transcriptional regulator, partial [Acidimicrobiales bacterium]